MKNWIRSAVTGMMFERPAQKLTLDQLGSLLEQSGSDLMDRFAAAPATDANGDQLRHIIGIERWGQSRLRVALGDALQDDDYDAYRPADDLDWDALQEMFRVTRADTLALAHALDRAGLDTTVTVPHNQYGKLTVYAWLRYLDVHSKLEGQRIK